MYDLWGTKVVHAFGTSKLILRHFILFCSTRFIFLQGKKLRKCMWMVVNSRGVCLCFWPCLNSKASTNSGAFVLFAMAMAEGDDAGQIQKLESALASEQKRCADKDKQLQMMEALLGRLQSRLELLEDNLKEQQRKNRLNSSREHGAAVLDLQQQLADELAKRKQAQYLLIEKGQELCDVQQKLAESQQRIKELLMAKSTEKTEVKKAEGKKCEGGDSGELRRASSPFIICASPVAKSPSYAPQSPCASRASSYAPAFSPCATPKSPADFKQFFPLPTKMMVPPLSLPLSGEKTSEQNGAVPSERPTICHTLEIPEMSDQGFLECPLPNTCYSSGYHTPIHVQPVQVQIEYPRILSALNAHQKKTKPVVKSARVISAEHRSVQVPHLGMHSMPLAHPLSESPRFSTWIWTPFNQLKSERSFEGFVWCSVAQSPCT